MSIQSQLWIGIGGLALPFVLGMKAAHEERKKGRLPTFFHPLPPIPSWSWVIFLVVLLVTRFYHLTDLPFWPISDEGSVAFYAGKELQHGNWPMLWGEDRIEPLGFWMLESHFKIMGISLFSMRSFSALISILTAWSAYWAARQYLDKTWSLLIAWSMAFSFWELTLTRTCLPLILGPLFQCLCLGWLIRCRVRPDFRNFLILGFLTGLGFYTWTNWTGFWLGLAGLFLVVVQQPAQSILPYLGFSCLTAFPLLMAKLHPGTTQHIQGLLDLRIWERIPSYFQALFWDGSATFPYGSNWGGFLNPLTGSLTLLGLIWFFRTTRIPWLLGASFCLGATLLPGLAANGIELYRILLALPLLMVLAAVGLAWSTASLSVPFRYSFVMLMLIASTGLDMNNYLNHYSRLEGVAPLHQWRSVRYYNAYRCLEKEYRRSGPLLILLEFNTDYDNKTLFVAAHPFQIQPGSIPAYIALLVNACYVPWLRKDFPQCRFEILGSDKKMDEIYAVVFIPSKTLIGKNIPWKEAEQFYEELDLKIKNGQQNTSWARFSEDLAPLENRLTGNPFFNAIYWEKRAYLEMLSGEWETSSRDYRRAIKLGYKAAHLYYDLGLCMDASDRNERGRQALRKAEE